MCCSDLLLWGMPERKILRLWVFQGFSPSSPVSITLTWWEAEYHSGRSVLPRRLCFSWTLQNVPHGSTLSCLIPFSDLSGLLPLLCAGWKATGLFRRSVHDKFSLDWFAFYVIWSFWLFWWRNGLWEMFTLLIIYLLVTLVPMCQAVPQFKCFPWHLIQEEWE